VRVSELRSSTTLAIARWEKHCKGVLSLDNVFALIDGHPAGTKPQAGMRFERTQGKPALWGTDGTEFQEAFAGRETYTKFLRNGA